MTEAEVRGILEGLGFEVACDVPGMLWVTVPSWRATKDISLKEDLLEEVGRMIGYDEIAPIAPLVAATPALANPERLFHRRVRNMAVGQGFTEVYNYSFLSEESAALCGLDPKEHLRVANPIASDQTLMRISLLPGVFKNIVENGKNYGAFRLFEIGREIHAQSESLPDEVSHVMAVSYAREGDGAAGLFELKHLAECLMTGVQVEPAAARRFEHPERSGQLRWRNEPVGRLFELHPGLGVEGRAAVLDVDLREMQKLDSRSVRQKPIRRFPTSAFDLSVITGLREPVGVIAARLATAGAPDLLAVEFVRQYTGAPLPEDRKSVSCRMTVGAPDRTLSSDEVAAVRLRIIDAMRGFGYELRV